MIKIVFWNRKEETPASNVVFRASGVRMASDLIYGVFNGNEVPIATGGGRLWRVGDRFFSNVEIQSITLKSIQEETRKAA